REHMQSRFTSLALLLILLGARTATAQQTGSVSGFILNVTGHTVSGASVRISGDPMPNTRTTVSSETGQYSFTQLLPGIYKVEAEQTGLGKLGATVEVQLGRDTQQDFVLGKQLSEVVSVTAPVVDVKKTEVNFNYKRQFTQNLPLDRSYLGLLQVVPGLAD